MLHRKLYSMLATATGGSCQRRASGSGTMLVLAGDQVAARPGVLAAWRFLNTSTGTRGGGHGTGTFEILESAVGQLGVAGRF